MTASLELQVIKADAVVVGAGPIGGLTAYQLARFGCVPYVIEQDNKPAMPIYGRACTLWPRTLELYDQLDVCDALLDVGVVSKTGLNFKDGKNAPGGLVFGHRMDRHGDTAFRFALHLRQRLTEQIFDDALAALGFDIQYEHRLESFVTDEGDMDGYPISCNMIDLKTGRKYMVKTKYLIGADGAKSSIRKAAGIEFIGERSSSKWIRMDALVKTDMPSPRALNSIQSEKHGLILFCPIDEGKTRIGYVFSKELQEKYGQDGVTLEVAKAEAVKAIAPFSLEFVSCDWFTLYGIGQCIASDFVKGRVILVGDSCHSHSSGSAQGLNTGTHDAVNLAWKLALVVKGVGRPSLLDSYNEERKASVQQVIDNDVIISTLISGNLPEKFKGRSESPRDLLTEWFESAATQAFTLGLGVTYPSDNLVNSTREAWPLSTTKPGERAPDVAVSRVGTAERVRLQKALPNTGAFQILIFTGNLTETRPSLTVLRGELDGPSSFLATFSTALFKFTTIIAGEGIGAAEYCGFKPFGRCYFDPCREAHEVYGIDPTRGAISVLRPDGIVGTVLGLEEAKLLKEYFARFLISK